MKLYNILFKITSVINKICQQNDEELLEHQDCEIILYRKHMLQNMQLLNLLLCTLRPLNRIGVEVVRIFYVRFANILEIQVFRTLNHIYLVIIILMSQITGTVKYLAKFKNYKFKFIMCILINRQLYKLIMFIVICFQELSFQQQRVHLHLSVDWLLISQLLVGL